VLEEKIGLLRRALEGQPRGAGHVDGTERREGEDHVPSGSMTAASRPDPAVLAALAELRSNVRVVDVATAPLFSAAECQEVLDACSADAWTVATKRNLSSADMLAGRDHEIESYVDAAAKSRVEQPLPGGGDGPFAQRIAEQVLAMNEEVYGFRVVGLEEPWRVMWYRSAQADHLIEHIDVGPQHPLRKLAFSVMLSDPDEFVGGDLVFSGRTFTRARAQGAVTLFPAFLPHLVSEMEHGDRKVIVGWVLGPSFI
jgi:predicted 2-oxoglutarate/Fe(II)-dependent dioxygenase YbiX